MTVFNSQKHHKMVLLLLLVFKPRLKTERVHLRDPVSRYFCMSLDPRKLHVHPSIQGIDYEPYSIHERCQCLSVMNIAPLFRMGLCHNRTLAFTSDVLSNELVAHGQLIPAQSSHLGGYSPCERGDTRTHF